MSAHGKINCWRLTPERIDPYTPGMDLGTPHWVEEPQRFVYVPEQFNGRIFDGRTWDEYPV